MKILTLLISILLMVTGQYTPTGGGIVYPHSGGAPTIVQPTSGNPLAPGCAKFATTNTCSYPVNVTAGNEAYILITMGTTGTINTPTLSAGTATLGTITAVGSGSTAGGEQQWYRASITGSGSATISETLSTSANMGVMIFEVTNDGGVDSGTNPVYIGASCFSTACNNAAITTSTNNDLLLYAVVGGTSATYSALTPYTASGTDNGSVGVNVAWATGNYTKTPAGAVGGTITTNTTVIFQNGVIAIK